MASRKVKKVLNIVLDVVLGVFFALCMFALVLTVSSKKSNDGAINIFGHQLRIVVSASMEKSDYVDVSQYAIKDIPVKSVVVIQLVPEEDAEAQQWYADLQVGDVLTFQYAFTNDKVITHRIVSIEPNTNGGYTIVLQGDNRDADSNTGTQTIDTSQSKTSPNYVIGKVTGVSYVGGVILYGLKQPVGLVLLVIVPCAIIIILQIIKVVEVFQADKISKAKQAEQQKADEIEELKRQLAQLRKEQGESVTDHDSDETDK